jgi:peptidoglycan/LPS O-acetylase OafA/YrhL
MTLSKSASGSVRLIGLDLLRLLAVVMVLGRHMETPPEHAPLHGLLDTWNRSGRLGVDLFFVLSGFLVSGLLFNEYKKYGDLNIRRFYVRRGWKIYPSFYFLLVVTYVYQLAIARRVSDHAIFSELFFLQNYRGGFWGHTWTLAVEEHFYLVLPLILLWLVRRRRGEANPFAVLPWAICIGSLALLGVRIGNFLMRQTFSYQTHDFPTHLRIDALFFGVALAYAYHFHAPSFQRTFRPPRYVLIAAGAMLIESTVVFRSSLFYVHTVGFMQTYVGAGAMIAGVLMCEIPENRVTRFLARLGAYSYSIYLWHMALIFGPCQALSGWALRGEFAPPFI